MNPSQEQPTQPNQQWTEGQEFQLKNLQRILSSYDWTLIDNNIRDLPQNPIYEVQMPNQKIKLYYQRFRLLLEKYGQKDFDLEKNCETEDRSRDISLFNWLLKYKTNNFYALMCRKDLIFCRFKSLLENSHNSEAFFNVLTSELSFINNLLNDNPKEYHLWTYKKDLLTIYKKSQDKETHLEEKEQVVFKGEMKFIYEMLYEDTRNYHAWDYNLWLIKFFSRVEEDLQHTYKLIYVNEEQKSTKRELLQQLKSQGIRAQELKVNWKQVNSLWNHRFALLKSHRNTLQNAQESQESILYEIENVTNFLNCSSESSENNRKNECAWNYVYGLIDLLRQVENSNGLINKIVSQLFTKNQLTNPKNSQKQDIELNRFQASFLLKIHKLEAFASNGEGSKSMVKDYLTYLKKIDPIRQKYYDFCLEAEP